MATHTLYGPGGYDPSKPNNNIVEEYEIADPEPAMPEPATGLAALLVTQQVVEVEQAAAAIGASVEQVEAAADQIRL